MQYLIKTGLSALIIVVVSEISKHNSLIGGLVASLPLVSAMALIWLYIDTRDTQRVSALAYSIFWMVIPSLSLFLVLPWLLKRQIPFYPAIGLACLLTGMTYYGTTLLYARLGIKL